MLKNQTVNHVSEHLSAICPVYTQKGGLKSGAARHRRPGSGVEPGKALVIVDSSYEKTVTLTPVCPKKRGYRPSTPTRSACGTMAKGRA